MGENVETEPTNAARCPKCGSDLVIVETSTLQIPVPETGKVDMYLRNITTTYWHMELRCIRGVSGDIDCDFYIVLPEGIHTDIPKVLKEHHAN